MTSDGKCLEMHFCGSDKSSNFSRVNRTDWYVVSVLGFSVIYEYGISTAAILVSSGVEQFSCAQLLPLAVSKSVNMWGWHHVAMTSTARPEISLTSRRSESGVRFSFYTKTHFIDTLTSVCVSPVHKQTRNEEHWSFTSCFARHNFFGTVRSNIQFYNLSLYYVTKGSDTSHIFFFEAGCFLLRAATWFCLLLNLCQVQQMASFSS